MLLLTFVTTPVFAQTFPGTAAELYCNKNGHDTEEVSEYYDGKSFVSGSFFFPGVQGTHGFLNYVGKLHVQQKRCKTKSFIEGYCFLSGATESECKGITAAKTSLQKNRAKPFRNVGE